MPEFNIRDKCLAKLYPDFELMWEEVRNAGVFHEASKAMDKLNSKWLTAQTYRRIKYRVFYGNPNAFKDRYFSKLGTDWAIIKRREDLYNRLYSKLELKIDKLINLKRTEVSKHNRSSDAIDSKSNIRQGTTHREYQGQEHYSHLEKPNSPMDMVAGEFGELVKSDLISVDGTTAQGVKKRKVDDKGNPIIVLDPKTGRKSQQYDVTPNQDHNKINQSDKSGGKTKSVEKGGNDTTIKYQEQPQFVQQVSRILQSFSHTETEFTDIINSYDNLGFYSTFMPMGEIDFDPAIGDYGFVGTETKMGGTPEEEEKKKAEGKGKSKFDKLTKEEYEQMKKAGEPVEKNLILENFVRRREEVKAKGSSKSGNKATLLKGLDGLIEAFWEPVLWTDLVTFDKVMGSITGFASFKRELRNRTELIDRYRKRGKKMKQVFYCLQGKAGVGKTEICRTLAKSYKRPLNILGMAGQNHPKILKGMRPTLDNAKYGRVAEAFIDCKYPVFKSITELTQELKTLKKKDKKALTKLEGERILFLETEIKEIEEHRKGRGKLETRINKLKEKINNGTATLNEKITVWELEKDLKNIDGKIYGLSSQAPIILLDEFEKAKDETVLFIVGQMTDKGVNFDYYDEFLECSIDLSQAIILLTSNYWHKVPDFVRSRCKRVNITLLSYAERLEILHTILAIQVIERFSGSEREEEWRKSTGELSDEQKRVLGIFGATQIKPNHWKVAGADQFLRLCMTEEFGVRGSIQNLEYALDFCELMDTRGWLGDITDLNNYVGHPKVEENVDGSGEIVLTYQFHNKEYPIGSGEITLDHAEYLTFDKKRDIEVIETTELKKGKYESVLNMVPDFKDWRGDEVFDKYWKPIDPTQDYDPSGVTPTPKPTPNAITIRPRSRLELNITGDDSLYKMEGVNVNVMGNNVNKLIFIAQFGRKNKGDYEVMIGENMTRDYDLWIKNSKKILMSDNNRTATILTKWDINRRT